MCSASILMLSMFLCWIALSAAFDGQVETEPRGKKKKIALFVYFADIVLKKIFVLKLIYAFVFWIVIHKAGYFLGWFVSVLKEKKHAHHEHHAPQHYDHGAVYGSSYGYGPYRRKSHGI